MKIRLNGVEVDLASDATVTQAVAAAGAPMRGVAVAVDGSVIPRSEWDRSTLREGAQVEVVTAAAGG